MSASVPQTPRGLSTGGMDDHVGASPAKHMKRLQDRSGLPAGLVPAAGEPGADTGPALTTGPVHGASLRSAGHSGVVVDGAVGGYRADGGRMNVLVTEGAGVVGATPVEWLVAGITAPWLWTTAREEMRAVSMAWRRSWKSTSRTPTWAIECAAATLGVARSARRAAVRAFAAPLRSAAGDGA